jgi:hypothetical protein
MVATQGTSYSPFSVTITWIYGKKWKDTLYFHMGISMKYSSGRLKQVSPRVPERDVRLHSTILQVSTILISMQVLTLTHYGKIYNKDEAQGK